MKRVLIDLTDIEGWEGHHGGTQRVVYGIAKQFFVDQSKDFQVEFIAFSSKKNIFYKTSFEPIYRRVESQESAPSSQNSNITISLKSRLKRLVLPYVPEKVRKNKYARKVAKNTFSAGMSIARKAKHSISGRNLISTSPIANHQIEFTEKDIVLVLGKPWDNPSMESALINAKADKGFKLVQVVYDLIIPLYPHLHHPTLYKSYTQYIFEAIYGSDLLLPISKCTQKDLEIFAKSLNLTMPKTKVIRLADEIGITTDNITKPDIRIENKFIACVGTIEIRKNHNLLYYVYKLAEQRGIELPQLVIVGTRGWLTSDLQYLVENDPKIKNKIIILDNINDKGLSWVYENCMFSVYPSFYEGWGLPVAESLAIGKVCIASSVSSIPEIAGDMLDYFTPYDAGACLDLIVKYLDPTILKQKENQIEQAYKSTNWDDTFTTVVDAIKAIK